eukprot:6087170-Pleurochrysis_carterae.AAC.4
MVPTWSRGGQLAPRLQCSPRCLPNSLRGGVCAVRGCQEGQEGLAAPRPGRHDPQPSRGLGGPLTARGVQARFIPQPTDSWLHPTAGSYGVALVALPSSLPVEGHGAHMVKGWTVGAKASV